MIEALKAGYKRTEVGVIPEDWEVFALGNLITEMRGGAPLAPSDFTESGVKVLPKGGVNRTGWLRVGDTVMQFCSIGYALAHSRNQVDETFTIVVLRDLVPSGPSIGLMVQIREPDSYVLAQGVYGFKITSQVIPRYLVQLSNTSWYRRLANSIMVGSTQVHITNTAFKLARVALPTKAEQQAIAEALSDADALIESLDQLIAKKRDLKQGAMQELLTGKRRLPGFGGEWEVKRLGSLGHFYSGGTPNTSVLEFYGGDVPWITSSDCNAGRIKNVEGRLTRLGVEKSATQWIRPGTVLVALYGATAGVVAIAEIDATINQAVLAIVLNDGSSEFLFQKISSMKDWIIKTFSQGGQPNLSGHIVKSIEISMPKREEQTAIATILSDMDTELAELQSRLAKARQIKQGMMQELLTGRIRLL